MILKRDDRVISSKIKGELLVCSKISPNEYLLYSPTLRYSLVLNVKELKKVI